ncbi:hypothetical protein Bpfe_025234 [Biomphalaria pfeifferi]|uniref:Retrotransposon gag domain-containing protein n=1 Tax=Biomphalaria pfeifferi TaxID=112525 RepID=A0AAD8AZL1_BIOPF|nr:hypothetical protein Bpfe_025234 [Biomphalaria pfeifferi]
MGKPDTFNEGAKPYATLRSLASPELPITKSYEELCKLLNNHHSPPPLKIMEIFKFHNRIQEDNETINEFITAIKALSEYCNFSPALLESLRDRFVCGLKDVNIQKRLLQEANLTLLTAINIATAMETAKRDAEQIQSNQAQSLHRIQTKKSTAKAEL